MVRTLFLPIEKGEAAPLPLALESGTLIEEFRSDRIKETLSSQQALKSCHSFRAKDRRESLCVARNYRCGFG